MKRWLQLSIALAAAAAVGCFSAYGLLSMHAPATVRVSASPTMAIVAAGAKPVSSPAPAIIAANSSISHSEQPATIVSYRQAVARAAPSVVTVYANHASKGPLPLAPKTLVQGLGSGVIVDPSGSIVTNYHVIANASELAVALADGTLHPTRIIAADPESDIALLKIDVDGLQPIAFADINEAAVGDVVLAVGNPLGVGQSVALGIISAIVREGVEPAENFIQTDAAINPGNSGGALIDSAGRLVGINTLILSHSGGSEGIGFAIPVDYVQLIADNLKTKGHVPRAWLGVSTGAPQNGNGALVLTVERGGPAERAGIAPGDVVVRFGDRGVAHPQDLRGVVIGAEPGMHVAIDFLRNGSRATADVELAPVPREPSP